MKKTTTIPKLFTIAAIALLMIISTVPMAAQTWNTPVTPENYTGTGGNTGQYSKLLTVNGNPAMAYYDVTHHNL